MIRVNIPSFRKVDDEHERSYTVSSVSELFHDVLCIAKQSACIALYYRTWNVVERTAYV